MVRFLFLKEKISLSIVAKWFLKEKARNKSNWSDHAAMHVIDLKNSSKRMVVEVEAETASRYIEDEGMTGTVDWSGDGGKVRNQGSPWMSVFCDSVEGGVLHQFRRYSKKNKMEDNNNYFCYM